MKTLPIKAGYSDSLISPVFHPGILLEAADLQQGVIYTQELMRLMVRHLFGSGVVCGLQINIPSSASTTLTFSITAGLALDCLGRPIHVPSDLNGLTHETTGCPESDTVAFQILLSHRSEQCRMKETRGTPGEPSDTVPTRLCEGYQLWIRGVKNEGACPAANNTADWPEACETCNCGNAAACRHVILGVISWAGAPNGGWTVNSALNSGRIQIANRFVGGTGEGEGGGGGGGEGEGGGEGGGGGGGGGGGEASQLS